MTFYLRTSMSNMPSLRRFAEANSTTLGQECPACGQPFEKAQPVTLIPLGPGRDPEERARARQGAFFPAVAMQVHWACATGEDDPPASPDEPPQATQS